MLSSSIFQISFTAALVLLLAGTRLDAKSVVVDDTDTSRITYSPTSRWNTGNTCTTCIVQLDRTKTLFGTWHDGYSLSNLDNTFFAFTFTGTSVEVRYITIDVTSASFYTVTNVSYWVDDGPRGNIVRQSANNNSYAYNQSLFTITGLSNVNHTLRVLLMPFSTFELDYLVYDDGSDLTSNNTSGTSTITGSAPSNTSPATADEQDSRSWKIIVGVVVPILCAVIAGAVGYFFGLCPSRARKETKG